MFEFSLVVLILNIAITVFLKITDKIDDYSMEIEDLLKKEYYSVYRQFSDILATDIIRGDLESNLESMKKLHYSSISHLIEIRRIDSKSNFYFILSIILSIVTLLSVASMYACKDYVSDAVLITSLALGVPIIVLISECIMLFGLFKLNKRAKRIKNCYSNKEY